MWIKPCLSKIRKSEGTPRTHHSLPQDQALRGACVDLQFDRLWRVLAAETEKKNNYIFYP